MSSWLPAALASLVFFGLWGFFTKLSVNHVDPKSALIFQTVGVLIIGLFTLSSIHFKPATDGKGFTYAVITGLTYGIGCLFYFVAASKGKIMTIVTLTSLYPVVTIVLSYLLLKEDINLRQCIGIMLAFVAIILMSN